MPWKRRRGYATRALALLLDDVRRDPPHGLTYVELTADPDNLASQRVIVANGGQMVERFTKPQEYGASDSLRFRIPLASSANATRGR